ncbi:MAG: ATP synthase F1 subunit gamma [Bacteroidota bacterium]
MSSLKEIRTRIASVRSTQKITSAMKMVAAAKLKKAQDAALNLRPYAGKLYGILMDITRSIENNEIETEYLRETNENNGNVLLVIITSNKGLCGAFNSSTIKKGVELANGRYSEQAKNGELFFYTIGRKGSEFFRSKGYNVYGSNDDILEKATFKEAAPLIQSLMDKFVNKEFERIEIIYNKFKNAAVYLLTEEKFLPIDMSMENEKESGENNHFDYIYEPGKVEIAKNLIPKILRIQFYEAILESSAAEHGARMTAMHKATDNATDLIKELQLTYNKARQAAITSEISEVVSGAEALKK